VVPTAQLNSERIKARQKILPGIVGTISTDYLGDYSVWRFRYNKVERITTSQTEIIKQQYNLLALSNIWEDLYNNRKNPSFCTRIAIANKISI
jgi:hypothetical protein